MLDLYPTIAALPQAGANDALWFTRGPIPLHRLCDVNSLDMHRGDLPGPWTFYVCRP